MREFDNDLIKLITAFENITESEVRDCIKNEHLYFLINPGKMALAIGKNGSSVKTAEKMLGKQIRVFEYSDNPEELLKNMIPQAQKIQIKGDKALVGLRDKDKGIVIGKKGSNIKIIKEFLVRNSSIKELEIK